MFRASRAFVDGKLVSLEKEEELDITKATGLFFHINHDVAPNSVFLVLDVGSTRYVFGEYIFSSPEQSKLALMMHAAMCTLEDRLGIVKSSDKWTFNKVNSLTKH